MKNAAAATANKSTEVNIDNKNENYKLNDQQHKMEHSIQQQQQLQIPINTACPQSLPLATNFNNQQIIPNPNNNTFGRRVVPHAIALYDFKSSEINDLSFKKGDVILLKRKIDSNWFVGNMNGREGTFPLNYVHVINFI